MNAFYQATISFTSQNYGAGKYNRINRILLTGQGCVIVVGVVLGNLAVLFGHQLLHIYSSNPDVIAAGMVRLHIISATYLRVFRQRAGIIADFDAGFFAQAKSGQVFPQLLHAQAVAHFADEVVAGIGDGLCDVL